MTDPIADMLTRIRNAQAVKQLEVLVPFSKVKFELGEILKREGYIKQISEFKDGPRQMIKIVLKYNEADEPVAQSLKRISKPGRRVYKKKEELQWVLQGMGIAIVSTSKGLMTAKEAKRTGLGGEVLCEIY